MCTGRCNVCICIQLDYKCSERTAQFISACYLGWGMYIYIYLISMTNEVDYELHKTSFANPSFSHYLTRSIRSDRFFSICCGGNRRIRSRAQSSFWSSCAYQDEEGQWRDANGSQKKVLVTVSSTVNNYNLPSWLYPTSKDQGQLVVTRDATSISSPGPVHKINTFYGNKEKAPPNYLWACAVTTIVWLLSGTG